MIADRSSLITQEAADMILRWAYCDRTGVPAFPGSYDDQPAYWLEVDMIARNEQQKALKLWQEQQNAAMK